MSTETGEARFVIDGREMVAPEPFEHTMHCLQQLKAGEFIQLILPRVPHPLFAVLDKRDIRYRYREMSPGLFEILIWQ